MICNKLSQCMESEYEKVICSRKGNTKEASTFECNKKQRCLLVADNRSNVKCEENRKTYNLENTHNQKILLYKMDGGIIEVDASVDRNICKCDYLYITHDNRAILTELKGTDVKHALNQIDRTMTLFNEILSGCSSVYGRIIMSSATPRLSASPQYTKLLSRLKRMNGNLKVQKNKMTEKIDDLDK